MSEQNILHEQKEEATTASQPSQNPASKLSALKWWFGSKSKFTQLSLGIMGLLIVGTPLVITQQTNLFSHASQSILGACITPPSCIAHGTCPQIMKPKNVTWCSGTINSPLTPPPSSPNQIINENKQPGSTNWLITNGSKYSTVLHRSPDIEGYANTTSVLPGQTINFSVSTTALSYTADIYRLGWYQGNGARLLKDIPNLPGAFQPMPAMDTTNGLTEANWPTSFSLLVPTNWVDGVYLVKLTSSAGLQSYIQFVLRSTQRTDFAFIHSADTENAYNEWGGASLYGDETNTLAAKRGYEVSFDRPLSETYGGGDLLYWEYPMIRWLEENGYNIGYYSDIDIHENGNLLTNAKAVLLPPHSEYWSHAMRNSLQNAVRNGISLGSLGGNNVFRQVRFESQVTPSSHIPDRVMICYKFPSTVDPLYGKDNPNVATEFRDDPVDNPEQSLLGSMYIDNFPDNLAGVPWIVSNASNFIFNGTGLKNGDVIPGIVGYEWDTVDTTKSFPISDTILASSPVINPNNGVKSTQNSTLYRYGNGALVFNAGTVWWERGLDNFNYFDLHAPVANNTLQQITKNILSALLNSGHTGPMIGNVQKGISSHTSLKNSQAIEVNDSTDINPIIRRPSPTPTPAKPAGINQSSQNNNSSLLKPRPTPLPTRSATPTVGATSGGSFQINQ